MNKKKLTLLKENERNIPTASELKKIATDSLNSQFESILIALHEQALLGNNFYIIEENLPELLIEKLRLVGYNVVPFYRKETIFFFKKIKKKVFKIVF